jgi:hypothetical protein
VLEVSEPRLDPKEQKRDRFSQIETGDHTRASSHECMSSLLA